MAIISGWLLIEFLIISFATVVAVYFYFKHFLYNFWRERGVVFVEPTIPFGNLGSLMTGRTYIGDLYADAYATHKASRYFGMYAFHKPSIVLTDPDIIKLVLTKEFSSFHDRGIYNNEKIDPLSGHLFLLAGSKWRNLRAKLRPAFTSGKLKQMFMTMVDCGDKVTLHLKPKAENREVVDIKDLFARYTTDVIMSTAFGISCDTIKDPKNEYRYWGQKIFEAKPLWNTLYLLCPNILELLSIKYTDSGITEFFTNAFKNNVEYREANNVTRTDFLNLMMQLMRRGYVDGDDDESTPSIAEMTGGKITMLEGAAQAFVFFFAGFETSSSTITYCLYELAQNQDVQDRLLEDIDSSLKKCGGLTYHSLQDMTYLHKVVSETLRKYPVLPVLNRVCTKDTELPTTNLRISKGLSLVIPILSLHRDPEIYPDPEKFDPERFSEENISARHPYSYLPFGEGPRICIGMRFGFAQTKVGLVSILSKYRVRMGPNTPVPLRMDPGNILMCSLDGIDLIVEPR